MPLQRVDEGPEGLDRLVHTAAARALAVDILKVAPRPLLPRTHHVRVDAAVLASNKKTKYTPGGVFGQSKRNSTK